MAETKGLFGEPWGKIELNSCCFFHKGENDTKFNANTCDHREGPVWCDHVGNQKKCPLYETYK